MFYCAQCPGSRFETREVLATHYKTSSQWHPYCWKCDIEFADEKLFDKHMLNNHRVYTCFYCSLSFGSENAVEHHTLTKHGRYRCELCDQGFETEVGRNRHYRDSPAHPTCSECGCGCGDNTLLEKHCKDAHPRGPCHLCKDRLAYLDEPRGHQHPICSQCLLGFEDNLCYAQHIDSLHPELEHCPLVATFDDHLRRIVADTASSDQPQESCWSDFVSFPSSLCKWSTMLKHEKDDDSDTDTEVHWTPTLSDYESATDDGDSGVNMKANTVEYRLHTNSPEWAALFPLPDSPKVLTVAIPAENNLNNEQSQSQLGASGMSPRATSSRLSSTGRQEDIMVSTGAQKYSSDIVQPCANHPVSPCATAVDLHEDVYYSPTDTRLQSEESSSRKASPSSCSPYLEEFAELPSPSGPGSLLSSEWSGSDSPEAFDGSGHNPQSSHLSVTCVFSQVPIDPFANVPASAVSPQAQNIPFQYADSIFEEKPLEDALEVDAIWEGTDDQKPMFYCPGVSNDTAPPHSLHCRLCLKDYCDDLTATMCGHIFCNSCITQSVIAKPRCPVCEAPTLLYCLFRIDLSM